MRDFKEFLQNAHGISQKKRQSPEGFSDDGSSSTVESPESESISAKRLRTIEKTLVSAAQELRDYAAFHVPNTEYKALEKWCRDRGMIVITEATLKSKTAALRENKVLQSACSIAALRTGSPLFAQDEEHWDFQEARLSRIESFEDLLCDGTRTQLVDQFLAVAQALREWWDEEDYAESHGQEPFAKLINEVAFFLSVGRDFVSTNREDRDFRRIGPGLTMVLVCWCPRDILDASPFDLEYISEAQLSVFRDHPRKLLDAPTLCWAFSNNADRLFDKIASWIKESASHGKDSIDIIIATEPEYLFSSIEYFGVKRWSIPVCPERFSLVADLRNLPHEISYVGHRPPDEWSPHSARMRICW